MFDDFVTVLSGIENLIVLDVYSAGEKAIPMADGITLVKALRMGGATNTLFAKDLDEAKLALFNMLEDGDLVVTMGAGSVGKLPQILVDATLSKVG